MLWPCCPVVLGTVRDLSDPETAFLGHLCDSTFCFLFGPFFWVLWLSCCAVIEPVLETKPTSTVKCGPQCPALKPVQCRSSPPAVAGPSVPDRQHFGNKSLSVANFMAHLLECASLYCFLLCASVRGDGLGFAGFDFWFRWSSGRPLLCGFRKRVFQEVSYTPPAAEMWVFGNNFRSALVV